MLIRRTANAGVLLKLDDISILLDGVCREVSPYLATPLAEKEQLLAEPPDVLVFTHCHEDHYDPDFAAAYQARTNGVIIGPSDLAGCNATGSAQTIGNVRISPINSRHIGKTDGCGHLSYFIEGTRKILFLGDASPLQWRSDDALPLADVALVPFAYAASASAWERVKAFGAKTVILLHMPNKDNDPIGLWNSVESIVSEDRDVNVHIPLMGDTIRIA